MTSIDLSKNDSKILDAVFDPESSTSSSNIEIDPLLPSDPHFTDPTILSTLRARELSAIRIIEQHTPSAPSSPRSATSSDNDEEMRTNDKDIPYNEALSILDNIVTDHHNYASVYNNRAQLHRWRYGDKSTLVQFQPHESASTRAITNALRDLDRAINLATPPPESSKVSPSQGKSLAQAWIQRAAIFWQAAKDLSTPSTSVVILQKEELPWKDWDKTNFEEEASRCFHMSGIYGSEVGKAMSVIANPHARLCGNIVKEAMQRERCGS